MVAKATLSDYLYPHGETATAMYWEVLIGPVAQKTRPGWLVAADQKRCAGVATVLRNRITPADALASLAAFDQCRVLFAGLVVVLLFLLLAASRSIGHSSRTPAPA